MRARTNNQQAVQHYDLPNDWQAVQHYWKGDPLLAYKELLQATTQTNVAAMH